MSFQRQLRLHYPTASSGRLVLRLIEDDEVEILEAIEVCDRGTCWVFDINSELPYIYYKASLVEGEVTSEQTGKTSLIVLTNRGPKHGYPSFWAGDEGTITEILELSSTVLDRPLRYRVYLPPGYQENTLESFPVLYMHDGKNLFLPEEAFMNREWMVDETLDRLDRMSVIDPCIVIGIYSPNDHRIADYTRPGYEAYGEAIVTELKPMVDARFRTIPDARHTAVAGSSLGGVVSFYLAWEYPETFGTAACMSTTFGWQDDLLERVLAEPKRPVRIYLDSGWPGDNYEVTLSMSLALAHRGYAFGSELLYFAFPGRGHNEEAWSQRLHLPFQFFTGKFRNATRPS